MSAAAFEVRQPLALAALGRIGGAAGEVGAVLSPHDIAIDALGRVYVADSGQQSVAVFDSSGNYVASLGRRGEGPGEFGPDEPRQLALAARHLFVASRDGSAYQVFDTKSGSLETQMTLERFAQFATLEGLPNGKVLGVRTRSVPGPDRTDLTRVEDLAVLDRAGGLELVASRAVEHVATFTLKLGRAPQERVVPALNTRVHVACGPERCFVADPLEYWVVALDATTLSARWVLEIPGTRTEIDSAEEKGQRELLTRMGRGRLFDADTIEFKSRQLPAIDRIAVDGVGNLYVFRWRTLAEKENAGARAVDVYSPSGELLLAGLAPNDYRSVWYAARANVVYGLDVDAEENEIVVARRLTLPGSDSANSSSIE